MDLFVLQKTILDRILLPTDRIDNEEVLEENGGFGRG
jgi:hypothetical protein